MTLFSRVHRIIMYVLRRVLALVEGLLGLRLILKFLTANSATWIVGVLYKITQVLIWPFNLIFPNVYLDNRLVEVVAISAMIGYIIIFFVIKWFLNFVWNE